MPALTIRRATREDLADIVAMLADDDLGAAREDASLPLDPGYIAAFEAIDADPRQLLAVALQGGDIVGTMQLTCLPGLSMKGAWHGLIEAVRVVRPLRGSGIGGKMIEWALDHFRRRGCVIAQLSSSKSRTQAHKFYERLGFTASHIGMKRKLT